MARMMVSKFPDRLIFRTDRDRERIFYQCAKYGKYHFFKDCGHNHRPLLPDIINGRILQMFVGEYIVGARAGAEGFAHSDNGWGEADEQMKVAFTWLEAGDTIHRAVELGIVVPVRGGVLGVPAWRLVSREPRWVPAEVRPAGFRYILENWTSVQVRGLPPEEQRRQHLREARAARRLKMLAASA